MHGDHLASEKWKHNKNSPCQHPQQRKQSADRCLCNKPTNTRRDRSAGWHTCVCVQLHPVGVWPQRQRAACCTSLSVTLQSFQLTVSKSDREMICSHRQVQRWCYHPVLSTATCFNDDFSPKQHQTLTRSSECCLRAELVLSDYFQDWTTFKYLKVCCGFFDVWTCQLLHMLLDVVVLQCGLITNRRPCRGLLNQPVTPQHQNFTVLPQWPRNTNNNMHNTCIPTTRRVCVHTFTSLHTAWGCHMTSMLFSEFQKSP